MNQDLSPSELQAAMDRANARDLADMAAAKAGKAFLQPKITGYRQLSQEEVDLMNEGKALAEQCGSLIERLRTYQPDGMHSATPGSSLDQRWISIGATDLQRGFMCLIRGIAQPTTF